MLSGMERGATAWAVVLGNVGDFITGVAACEVEFESGGIHAAFFLWWSAISMRSHNSVRSMPPTAPATQTMSPATDQKPMPSSTSASLTSLRRLTIAPRKKTSTMTQAWMP